jgi:hypothetical protein
MNKPSRIITGAVIILFGLWLISFVGFIDGPGFDFWGFGVGALFLILGIFILLNKKEDEIEQIKSAGTKSRGGKK